MHRPREDHDTIDFMGLSIDVLSRPQTNTIANVESGIDHAETAMALEHFAPTDRILIAGGGLGGQAALLASKFGVEQVVVVEPNPAWYALVRQAVRVRGRALDIRHGALSVQGGSGVLYMCADDWSASGLQPRCENPEQVIVPFLSLNELIRAEGITALLLDVEGAEVDLLPTLATARLRVVVVEVHELDQVDAIAARLLQGGLLLQHREQIGGHVVLAAVRRSSG